MTTDPSSAGSRLAWTAGAACTRVPGLPWTTDETNTPTILVEMMREVCAGCRVFTECQTYAEGEDVTGGWWAGQDRDPDARIWAAMEWDGDQGLLPLGFEDERGAA